MLELDVILIPFFEKHFDDLNYSQKADFVGLLDEADPDIFNWLMGSMKPTDNAHVRIVDLVKKSREL